MQRKCRELDTVEEVVPLYDRTLSIRTKTPPKRVGDALNDRVLPFEFDDGYTRIRLPCLDGRTILYIEL